jgi:hypothetical protein
MVEKNWQFRLIAFEYPENPADCKIVSALLLVRGVYLSVASRRLWPGKA